MVPAESGQATSKTDHSRGGVFALAAFIVVSAGLGLADSRRLRAARDLAEKNLAESVSRLVTRAAPGPPATATSAASQAASPAFTGRYRLGPERAPIRLVLISDYQCIDCQRIEREVRALMTSRTDLSLSAKHFPFCMDCNTHLTTRMHPNACWAARAAETAGILRGNDGFWAMHHWLFDRGGGFTDAQLRAGVAQLGHDPDEFVRVMGGDETLRRVRTDVDEAHGLGLFFTPMIFINGVELKGWNAERAVTRAVEALAATHPPAAGPETDRPPPALDRYMADWREQPVRALLPVAPSWPCGPANSRVRIEVFGDYQEPGTVRVDRLVRRFAREGRVQYAFRPFPFNKECNAMVPDARFPLSCRAAQAAIAAGRVGGSDALWRMHDWLMEHPSFDDAALHQEAVAAGLDAVQFATALQSPEVRESIASHVQAARQIGLTAIPMIFINGRHVPRWELDGQNLLDRMVDEAGRP